MISNTQHTISRFVAVVAYASTTATNRSILTELFKNQAVPRRGRSADFLRHGVTDRICFQHCDAESLWRRVKTGGERSTPLGLDVLGCGALRRAQQRSRHWTTGTGPAAPPLCYKACAVLTFSYTRASTAHG